MRWHPVQLSRRQVKTADRVGGADLILPWPDDLPPGEATSGNPPERPTTPEEHAAAERIVGDACRANDLVPARSWVAMMRRPLTLPRGGETLQHLVIWICGRRWVHATGSPAAVECWHPIERIRRDTP